MKYLRSDEASEPLEGSLLLEEVMTCTNRQGNTIIRSVFSHLQIVISSSQLQIVISVPKNELFVRRMRTNNNDF
jgi:ABC-type proline/glycine betaine transport system permease subunit